MTPVRAAPIWLASWLVIGVLACSRSPAPRAPSNEVRTEIARAETAERARQHEVARKHYQRAIELAHDPVSAAFARRELAETLISWGEYDQAIIELEAVVDLAPAHAAAWHDLGMLYHQRGDNERAMAALERSRAAAPRDPRPRITLAVLRWKRGDLAGATREYRELLELDLPDGLRSKVKWALD
ncbi:MAG: tetratricopeptide repeat protein, partial [Kofleriaceae bacterium]